MVSLDDWISETGARSADAVKIDVEGHEIEVLAGAARLIRQHLPKILVEVHWLGREFADYFDTHLAPLGYSALTLEGAPLPTEIVRFRAALVPHETRAPPD
jgi:hypothetical protein